MLMGLLGESPSWSLKTPLRAELLSMVGPWMVFWVLLVGAAVEALDNSFPQTRISVRQKRDEDFPKRSKDFVNYHMNYMGWNYAGLSEFPWVVDLRTLDSENWKRQEEWATGNLMTLKHVLTSCNAVSEFHPIDFGDVIGRHGKEMLVLKNASNYKVMYASSYHYLSNYANPDEIGTRLVSSFSAHPHCAYYTLQYHFGVVELAEAIYPLPPLTGYMPIDMDKPVIERNVYLAKSRRWKTCDLAIWGRRYNRYNNDMIHNFKLKYMVNFVDMSRCQKGSQYMNYSDWVWLNSLRQRRYLYCMELNKDETMGAICDHDRGAPVVCDNRVVALVVRGCLLRYCDHQQQLPFVVLEITDALQLYSHLNRFVLNTFKLLKFNSLSLGHRLGVGQPLLLGGLLISAVWAARPQK